MKNLLLFFLLMFPLFLFSQNYNGPESVEGDTLTGDYYISNTNSNRILKRLPDGTLENFAANFSSGPYGLEIIGDVIYACNGGEVRGHALNDGSQIFSVQTGGSFLNGITHANNGFLYVTDFSGKRIYKVDISNENSELFVADTESTPNGIVYDFINDRLVFVSWGSGADIVEVDLSNGNMNTLVSTNLSNIDGIAMDGDGNFYVSSWGADAIHKFEPTFSDPPELVIPNLDRPADIFYNLKTDTLAVPNSGNNTVTFAFFGEEPPSYVGEFLFDFKINVFPNPAHAYLTVNSEVGGLINASELRIFSQNGQLMDVPFSRQNGQAIFDVKNLLDGTYLFVATYHGESSFYPFVKK